MCFDGWVGCIGWSAAVSNLCSEMLGTFAV